MSSYYNIKKFLGSLAMHIILSALAFGVIIGGTMVILIQCGL